MTDRTREQRCRTPPARPPAERRGRGLDDPATPMVVVDLDAFDANAADLVRRAARQAVRVASKSLRVPALCERALADARVRGRARLLAARGAVAGARGRHRRRRDGLPDRRPRCAARPARRRAGAGPGHADGRRPAPTSLVEACAAAGERRCGWRSTSTPGCGWARSHVGPKRSPLYDAERGRRASPRRSPDRGFALVGVMTYEGQVAGVPDDVPSQRAKSLVVRKLKSASIAQLEERRAEIARRLRERGRPGVLERRRLGQRRVDRGRPAWSPRSPRARGCWCRACSTTTESFEPRPAAFFGLPVVRRPADGAGDRRRRRLHRQRPHRQGPARRSRGHRPTCT